MLSLEEKKSRVSSETWIHILMSVEDLISKGYLDPSQKDSALNKFLTDYIERNSL